MDRARRSAETGALPSALLLMVTYTGCPRERMPPRDLRWPCAWGRPRSPAGRRARTARVPPRSRGRRAASTAPPAPDLGPPVCVQPAPRPGASLPRRLAPAPPPSPPAHRRRPGRGARDFSPPLRRVALRGGRRESRADAPQTAAAPRAGRHPGAETERPRGRPWAPGPRRRAPPPRPWRSQHRESERCVAPVALRTALAVESERA
jgi:hypothetical protein